MDDNDIVFKKHVVSFVVQGQGFDFFGNYWVKTMMQASNFNDFRALPFWPQVSGHFRGHRSQKNGHQGHFYFNEGKAPRPNIVLETASPAMSL